TSCPHTTTESQVLLPSGYFLGYSELIIDSVRQNPAEITFVQDWSPVESIDPTSLSHTSSSSYDRS
ncbi:unnamed protein product, partial [Allacma fusca]